ncbi:MAG: hypothetical protein AAGJ46_08775 [Planctomycetota bacterium]
MPPAIKADDLQILRRELLKQGVALLCQQIWCWGRDILRPEGNWLVELGFERVKAPEDLEQCSSVYTLQLPRGRRVVLRGFGVFFGDDSHGGVFLPRYEFAPKFTANATLNCPPWSANDLPELTPPDESNQDACRSMTLDLIDWIHGYEANVVEQLGIDYRRSTLADWKGGKRKSLPAEELAGAWRSLGETIAEHPAVLIPAR